MLLFYWLSNTIEVELGRNEDDHHLGGCFHLISIILVRKTALISIFLFFWKGYTFFGIYFRLLVLISIVELGILGLGLASIQKIAFSLGFLVLSILGLLLYSFFLFDIYQGIRTLTQLKMKIIDTKKEG